MLYHTKKFIYYATIPVILSLYSQANFATEKPEIVPAVHAQSRPVVTAGCFTTEIDALIDGDELDSERLMDLQDYVFGGTVSPVEYAKGIVDLLRNRSEDKEEISKARQEFYMKLREEPEVLVSGFGWDFSASLTYILDSKTNKVFKVRMHDLRNVMTFYGNLLNPFDFFNSLGSFSAQIQAKQETLKLSPKNLLILNKALRHFASQVKQEDYEAIKKERELVSLASLAEEIFGKIPQDKEEDKVEDLPLPPAEEKPFSLLQPIKTLANLGLRGMKYAVDHPGETIITVLAAQVAAAAALNTLKVPEVKMQGMQGKNTEAEPSLHSIGKRSVGAQFQVSPTYSFQPTSSVVTSPTGFLAGWGNSTHVLSGFFDTAGTPLTNPLLIGAANGQLTPYGTCLSTGNCVVAYLTSVQSVLTNGTLVGPALTIPQNPVVQQSGAFPAPTTGGGFGITWGKLAGSYNVLWRQFNSAANGSISAVGSDITINQVTTGNQLPTTMSRLPTGNLLVTYIGDQAGVYNSYGIIISPTGSVITSDFPIAPVSTTTATTLFNAAPTTTGAAAGWLPSGGSMIQGCTISNTGVVGSPFTVNQNPVTAQVSPAVIPQDDGNLLYVWGNLGKDIGRYFDASGTPLTNEFTIVAGAGGTPVGAQLPGKSAVMLQAGGTTVFGNIVTQSGIVPGVTTGPTVGTTASTTAGGTTSPAVTTASTAGTTAGGTTSPALTTSASTGGTTAGGTTSPALTTASTSGTTSGGTTSPLSGSTSGVTTSPTTTKPATSAAGRLEPGLISLPYTLAIGSLKGIYQVAKSIVGRIL